MGCSHKTTRLDSLAKNGNLARHCPSRGPGEPNFGSCGFFSIFRWSDLFIASSIFSQVTRDPWLIVDDCKALWNKWMQEIKDFLFLPWYRSRSWQPREFRWPIWSSRLRQLTVSRKLFILTIACSTKMKKKKLFFVRARRIIHTVWNNEIIGSPHNWVAIRRSDAGSSHFLKSTFFFLFFVSPGLVRASISPPSGMSEECNYIYELPVYTQIRLARCAMSKKKENIALVSREGFGRSRDSRKRWERTMKNSPCPQTTSFSFSSFFSLRNIALFIASSTASSRDEVISRVRTTLFPRASTSWT